MAAYWSVVDMISIPNLTPKQKVLLDVMWNIENIQQVNDFINSLPPKDKIDARSLLQIAINESIEHEGGLAEWETAAITAIDFAQNR
jgi:hypothetical protein